jgi:hypothetical protein
MAYFSTPLREALGKGSSLHLASSSTLWSSLSPSLSYCHPHHFHYHHHHPNFFTIIIVTPTNLLIITNIITIITVIICVTLRLRISRSESCSTTGSVNLALQPSFPNLLFQIYKIGMIKKICKMLQWRSNRKYKLHNDMVYTVNT